MFRLIRSWIAEVSSKRDYIRRELDMFFSTVAEGFHLKTWRGRPIELSRPHSTRQRARHRLP